MKTALLVCLQLAVAGLPLFSAIVSVPGDANIFGSGHAFVPNPGGGAGGTPPPTYLLGSNETILSFTVTGSNTLTAEFGYHGPDGNRSASSQVYSYSGLSGITADSAGFLVGVFLGPDEPIEPGPTWLSFNGGNDRFSTLGPRLAQLFFIGDGLVGDGSGERQMFFVPTNATRLFLGFADANGYVGPTGQYQDNAGELNVQVQPVVLNTNQSPPLILAHPEPQALYETQIPALFQVQAIGASPMSFQWLKNGTPVDSSESSLQLPAAAMSDAGYYSVVITNAYGAVTSAPAYLNVVSSSIAISFQPRDATNVLGASVWFSVSAGSSAWPLWGQWQFNGNNLPSQTNFFLTLTNIQPENEGTYRIVISNSFQSVTSAPARLTVIEHGPNWFGDLQAIGIDDDDIAFPYPSTIDVSGLAGVITNLTVSLLGLEHEWPDDVDILLVGPRGQSVMLMSDAGGGFSITNVNLFYAADAGNNLPDSGLIVSGKARPTNFGEFDHLPLPAPPGPYGSDLSVFIGTDPNGTWRLFVRDDEEDGWGMINGGWRIDFDGTTPVVSGDTGALDRWHTRYSSLTNNVLGVTAYPGGFVAVGSLGSILTSLDGLEWTPRTSGTNAFLYDAAFGDGAVVTVGSGGAVMTSVNGSNWVRRVSATNATLYDVTYGDGLFVAVGEGGTIQTSLDAGVTWQVGTSGTNRTFNGVAYGQGRFVAVGSSGTIRVSTNGLNWMPAVTVSNTAFIGLNSVAYGNGLFIAVGDSGTLLTSPDGMNWARQTVPIRFVPLFDVIYANGQFVCGGPQATLFSSINGVNWVARTFPTAPFAPFIQGITFNDETFVAICNSTTNLIYQSDPVFSQSVSVGVAPRSTSVILGRTTNLTVTAVGTSPFYYQWLREGLPIPRATNRTLVFSNAQTSVAGQYAVAISNAFGTVTSASVTLTVPVPPIITVQPISQEVVAGGTVTLSIAVTGTPPFIYRWRQPSSIFTLTTSSNHQSFLTVTNVQGVAFGTYGVYVTNDFGYVVSRAAQITLAADADGDGLADSWEQQFGLITNDTADAGFDLDGDGANSLDEYRAGTNPTNAASVLKLEFARSNQTFLLRFLAESNKTYAVQFSHDIERKTWVPLAEFVAKTNRRTGTIVAPISSNSLLYRLASP